MNEVVRLNYCASWTSDRAKTWSGTTWSLEQALKKSFRVNEVDLAGRTLADRAFRKVRRAIGEDDFDLGIMRRQQIRFEREAHPQADVWFQFSEVPMPVKGERHYVYQDLAVEWLARCMTDDPGTFVHTGFADVSHKAMRRRAQVQREFYEKASGVFTMGKWMADFLVNDAGLPAEKVHHVGGGLNTCASPDFSARDGRTFIFAGRDFRRKGGDLVLAAFNILHSRDKDLRLLIAGPKSDYASGHEGVEFVGDLANDALGALFAQSDCFVMPSRFEAYGLVFPEALACALPCVGRKAFEMQHFIKDGATGRLVGSDDPEELAEAMLDCLTNSTIKQNVIEGAPDIAKQYCWDAVADRIYSVVVQGA
ncbi:MAG: glycosyltransferase family 4 protein [Coriobacteriia bacterium]|nr:glycosyltransferase family 4 protein [Coriobacteriia bacterium]